MTYRTPTTSGGKPFPTLADKAGVGTNAPVPEIIGRADIPHGRWTVENCRPVRGEPMTSLDERTMLSPHGDDEVARCIRAHELMHSKVSPNAEQMQAFIDRGIASATAMTVVEELRVNFLCEQAGFEVRTHLTDGSELASGEALAKSGDWAGAVAMCMATANTAGHKAFLTGIRRHNRAWGDALLDIGKRAVREMKKAHRTGTLASTQVYDGVAPYGFTNTERLAEWLDRLASFPPPVARKKPPKGKTGTGADKEGEGKTGEQEGETGSESEPTGKTEGEEGDRKGNPHGKVDPAEYGGAVRWEELVVSHEPLPRHHKGSLGRKRIATNVGIRPRRMHRYMTDPAKRVFDKTVRGSGGVVIVDASGSMSITTEQIVSILENAPGATVLIYSDRYRGNGSPNAWVVADKGRMVENVEYIDYGHGNGVDYPAIEWGVRHRQSRNTPIVWVTDGGVCGARDGFSDLLAMQCINYARQNGYIVVPDVDEAIEQLRMLRIGGNAKSIYPAMFQNVWRKHMGTHLRDENY